MTGRERRHLYDALIAERFRHSRPPPAHVDSDAVKAARRRALVAAMRPRRPITGLPAVTAPPLPADLRPWMSRDAWADDMFDRTAA